jgi:cob(I)alamin adenosyltransferase
VSESAKRYISPYEAYPFLSDPSGDLRCDFEISTDGFASETGLLSAILRKLGGPERAALAVELDKVNELVYHANPALRTYFSVTDEEILWLKERATALYDMAGGRQESLFQLPNGSEEACRAHILRSKAKGLVRMAYNAEERGVTVPDALYDFLNLLSGYFYRLALYLNTLADVAEIPYYSRNY